MFIFIPGELVSLLTFPGIILHEIAHRFACDLLDIPVYHISYFNMFHKKNSGHVIHEKTTNILHSFLIGIAPFIINSIACMLLLLPFGLTCKLNTFLILPDWMDMRLVWPGFSIGFHAIPSNKDMEDASNLANDKPYLVFLLLVQGIVALFNLPMIGSILRILYACMLPYMFASLFV